VMNVSVFWRVSLVSLLVIHVPVVLIFVPFVNVLAFIPFLLYLNIPTQVFDFGALFGPNHFELSAYGYSPISILSWIVIFSFWLFISMVFGLSIALIKECLSSREVESSN
jgi:hypothetical protein